MSDNSRALRKGFNLAEKIIAGHLIANLVSICGNVLHKVAKNREFTGWSGNTQRSYMGGVYYKGRLVQIVNQENWTHPALRKKLKKGQWGYLKNPYEGVPRSVYGAVDTDGKYGEDTSKIFLHQYKGCPKKGFAMVITTGTEYSEYIEGNGLDVLTNTFLEASEILANGFKPLPE